MAFTTTSSHSCWICGEELSLFDCKVDEQGRAVHEQCYIARISLNSASEQSYGRPRNGTPRPNSSEA